MFVGLRFLTLFILGVLLLNLKLKQKETQLIKPNLAVVVDNSNSIKKLSQDDIATQFLSTLKATSLSDKFNIDYYSFGSSLEALDTLGFSKKQTNISNVFSNLKEVYSKATAPTILLTDGNQTVGEDFIISSLTYNQPIYPVVLGDSILKSDLRINTIQHNKYAFLGNEYPVEVNLSYVGNNSINQKFIIFNGAQKIFSKSVSFSKEDRTQVIQFNLKANRIGKQFYTAVLENLKGEENTINNSRKFNISVIDERTKVLLVSSISHPDIGTLIKAIETNKQRKVTLVKPTDNFDINEYQLVINYQPNAKFKSIFDKLKLYDKNYLTLTGLHTDWIFLNSVSANFTRNIINQPQEYNVNINKDFTLFQYDSFDIEAFPPLLDFYGDLKLKNKANTVFYQQIGAISTDSPLLSFYEQGNRREALLIGEGIWKWRSKNYMNQKNFEFFDAFIGKTIQYLSSTNKKERLIIDAEDEYFLGETKISAQYFDKNYQFDSNVKLKCVLTNTETKEKFNYDFSPGVTNYILDLTSIEPATYEYNIHNKSKEITKKGTFMVLDFNIEAQFLNADVTKLRQLASNSKNKLYFSSNYNSLFETLLNDDQYKPVQKVKIIEKPLIEWEYLLGLLIILLSIEWLLRKYKGLI